MATAVAADTSTSRSSSSKSILSSRRGMRRRLAIVTAVLASCAGLPAAAWAHGFAVRYDLPIPLPFYLAGAGCTVALSFVLLGAFAHGGTAHGARASWQRTSWSAGRVLSNPWVAGGLQVLSVAL